MFSFTFLAFTFAAANSDFNSLYKLYNIKEVKTHYVIVVDTSLSMKMVFPLVRKSLLNFASSLSSKDTLTFINFANQPQKLYARQFKKEALRKVLPKTPNPKGTHTDIGAAFKEAITNFKPKQELNVLIFITDGLNDPPPESHFQQPEVWQKLKEELQTLNLKHLSVFGLGLNQQTDVAQLEKVFPQPQVMTTNPNQLNQYFRKLKTSIKQEKLKAKIEKELKTGRIKFKVTQVKTVNRNRADLTLTANSSYDKLLAKLSLQQLKVKVNKEKLTKVKLKPTKVEIKPGQSKSFLLEINFASAKQPLVPLKNKVYRGHLKFKLKKTVAYHRLLTKLGFKLPQTSSANISFKLPRQVGYSYLTILAVFSFLLLAALLGWRLLIKPLSKTLYRQLKAPLLDGRLVFYGCPPNQKLPHPILLKQYGSKVTLGLDGDIKLSGSDIKPNHAELAAVWEQNQKAIYLKAVTGEVKVATKKEQTPLPVKEVKLEKGIYIGLGEYKMQWL